MIIKRINIFLVLLLFLFFAPVNGQVSEQSVRDFCKLLVSSDCFTVFEGISSPCDISHLSIEKLPAKGLRGVSFFKVTYRDLKKLKFYMQSRIWKKENGNWFNFSEKKFMNYFLEFYGSVDSINSIPFYERKIGEDKFRRNEVLFQGDFVVAYIPSNQSFFRLKGFRFNEFDSFFMTCFLLDPRSFLSLDIYLLLGKHPKKRQYKKALSLISMPDLNFVELYGLYLEGESFRDRNSCYEREMNWMDY